MIFFCVVFVERKAVDYNHTYGIIKYSTFDSQKVYWVRQQYLQIVMCQMKYENCKRKSLNKIL